MVYRALKKLSILFMKKYLLILSAVAISACVSCTQPSRESQWMNIPRDSTKPLQVTPDTVFADSTSLK